MPALENAAALAEFKHLGDATGVAKTTTYTSTSFDTQGYEGAIAFLQSVGTVSGTTPTLDGKIQDCDTSGGTYADVTGATFAQVTATGSIKKTAIDVKKLRRFVKYVGTIAGTTPSFVIAVVVAGVKKVT